MYFFRYLLVIASSAFGVRVNMQRVVFPQPLATTLEMVQQIVRGARHGGVCDIQVYYNNLECGKAKQAVKDLLKAKCKRGRSSLHLINNVYSAAYRSNHQTIMPTYRS